VAALKAVQGDGIFYIDTHGFSATNRQGEEVFGIATSTSVDASEEDLDTGRLVDLKTGGSATSYLITAAFVRRYMSFAENAFVFINACGSDSNEAFRRAFLDKGAAFYAGWSQTVRDSSANIAAKFAFDRLLGANHFSLDREEPAQRPFGYLPIWMDMRQRNYDLDRFERHSDDPDWRGGVVRIARRSPAPPAQLRLHAADVTRVNGGLRPSIYALFPDEAKGELHILGSFGRSPDEVTVDGSPVQVTQFVEGAEYLTCRLPVSGAGSAGLVIVRVAGRVSNAVPLTEWRIRFRYTEELIDIVPPLKKTAIIDMHLRGDIHPTRNVPHMTPRPFGSSPVLSPAGDSKVHWAFSGTGEGSPHVGTYALSGSGSATWGDPQRSSFVFMGRFDPATRAFTQALVRGGVWTAGTRTTTLPDGNSWDAEETLSIDPPEAWDMPLDASYGISAGAVTWEGSGRRMLLEWDAAPAGHPPTADTLSRAVPSRDRGETVALAVK
jgi:hypothetical protein